MKNPKLLSPCIICGLAKSSQNVTTATKTAAPTKNKLNCILQPVISILSGSINTRWRSPTWSAAVISQTSSFSINNFISRSKSRRVKITQRVSRESLIRVELGGLRGTLATCLAIRILSLYGVVMGR